MEYIAIGVGCNCLVTLEQTGILNALRHNGHVSLQDLGLFGDSTSINSALITLEKTGIINRTGDEFFITEFGKALSEYIGLITIFFDGYANLVAHQAQIAQSQIKDKQKFIRGSAVSKAATLISTKLIDPIIIREILEVNLSGTICDLGCGYATMLAKICKETGNPGLGFDNEPKVIKQSKKRLKKANLTLELGDISKLEGTWEDVAILMQCHVFHDFTPDLTCIEIMNSYLTNFPNLKCFFYIDSVAPSLHKNEIFPGFDYVHGLLGITTRTYEETLKMFSESMYEIVKEVTLELPNTFLWVLTPKQRTVQ